MHDAIETEARLRIRERVSRADRPRPPQEPRRRRLAERLRRVADRLDA